MTVARQNRKSLYLLYAVLVCALVVNIGFWYRAKTVLPKWNNVPTVPTEFSMSGAALGDDQVAYRMTGYFLQNTGNVGGNYELLKIYNYETLEKWFYLSETFDPKANYVPFLAAYYFGALEDPPEKLDPVIRYLAHHGQLKIAQKWRWLAHAVYLSRYKQGDMEKALKYANILHDLDVEMAPWARQMPAFVNLGMGNKQAAYELMVRMLASEKDKVHPNEVNEMVKFICERALEPAQARENPLCQKSP